VNMVMNLKVLAQWSCCCYHHHRCCCCCHRHYHHHYYYSLINFSREISKNSRQMNLPLQAMEGIHALLQRLYHLHQTSLTFCTTDVEKHWNRRMVRLE
jgi:hypothetical protein